MQSLEAFDPRAMETTYLVQDRLSRMWGTAVVTTVSPEGYFGHFLPAPDFVYLRGRYEEYEAHKHVGARDLHRLGELYEWLVSLRPVLVPAEGEEIPLLCILIERTAEGLTFTGLRHT